MDLPPKLRKVVLSACQARTNSLGMSRFFRMQILWRQWNNGILSDTLLLIFPFGREQGMYSRTCWFIKPSFTDDFTFVCFWWCLPPHYLFAVCWFFSHLIPFILRYIEFHLKWTHPPVAAADELTGDQTTDCNFRRWVDQIICKMGCWSEKTKTMVGNWWSSEWLGTLMLSCFCFTHGGILDHNIQNICKNVITHGVFTRGDILNIMNLSSFRPWIFHNLCGRGLLVASSGLGP